MTSNSIGPAKSRTGFNVAGHLHTYGWYSCATPSGLGLLWDYVPRVSQATPGAIYVVSFQNAEVLEKTGEFTPF